MNENLNIESALVHDYLVVGCRPIGFYVVDPTRCQTVWVSAMVLNKMNEMRESWIDD